MTGNTSNARGFRLNDNTQFINGENGIIKFNGEIKSNGTGTRGINITDTSNLVNEGKIIFDKLTGVTSVLGIFQKDATKLTNTQTGSIEFNGEITAAQEINTFGIEIRGISELATDGNIIFVNELSTASDRVTGSGNITFDNGAETYY